MQLTIIIPVYNVQNFLSKCIDSVLCQSFTDFEVILIDDGSTDGSEKICDEYKAKDQRVKVIHQQNAGVSNARNSGIRLAEGSYITFIDGDDWIEKDTYEILMADLLLTGCDIAVGSYVKEYEDKKRTFSSQRNKLILEQEDAIKEMLKKSLYSWELCDKVYKKFLFKNLYLDESISHGEDLLMNWYIFNAAKKIVYHPIYKYHYVERQNSACTCGFSINKLTFVKSTETVYRESIKVSSTIQKITFGLYLTSILHVCLKMLQNNPKQYQDRINKFQDTIRMNLMQVIRSPNIPLKKKMGLVFFSLPYSSCIFLKKILDICKCGSYSSIKGK